jgi:hypothetical protein
LKKDDTSMEKIAETGNFCSRVRDLFSELMETIRKAVLEGDEIREADLLVREGMGEVGRELLGEILTLRGRKETYGSEIKCKCGGKAVFKQYRSHEIGTILPGKTVRINIAYYVCEACHEGTTPLLNELGTDGDGASIALQELTVLAGVMAPFEEASNLLSKFSGINVSGTRIQTRLVEEGKALKESGMESVEIKDDILCVAIDGGMVHVDDRWQEVKLGVIYGEDERIEVSEGRRKLVNRDVVAVRGGPEDFLRAFESRFKCDPVNLEVVVLADGAKWIWNTAADLFPNRIEILDYYHAAEHLWLCASTLFGENSQDTVIWVEEQKKRLFDDKIRSVIDELVLLRRRFNRGHKRKALDDLTGYFENNAHRMLYKTFLEKGHPIGSGPVESAVKHVVQCRMKRPGTHWRARGADAMLCLRCLHRSSGQWDRYWDTKKTTLKVA